MENDENTAKTAAALREAADRLERGELTAVALSYVDRAGAGNCQMSAETSLILVGCTGMLDAYARQYATGQNPKRAN